jgi:CRP-like cAMP-binding protein
METSAARRSETHPTSPNPAPGVLAMLQSCSKTERRALRSLAIHRHVDRGQVICEVGEFADELFVVLDGAVVVWTAGDTFAPLGAGDAFGEMAPLARTPRRTTATALAPTALLVFRRREFAKLLDRAPRVARTLLRAANTRLRSCSAQDVEVDARAG